MFFFYHEYVIQWMWKEKKKRKKNTSYYYDINFHKEFFFVQRKAVIFFEKSYNLVLNNIICNFWNHDFFIIWFIVVSHQCYHYLIGLSLYLSSSLFHFSLYYEFVITEERIKSKISCYKRHLLYHRKKNPIIFIQ